jgi:uncharacterized protein (DUF111 family)
MRTLLIDPFHGAAGDMITGALLSLIDEKERVLQAMASVVGEPGTEVVRRSGITALKVHTHALGTHRTADEVLAKIHSAKVPPEVIERAIKIFNRISSAESRVHGYDLRCGSNPEEKSLDHRYTLDHHDCHSTMHFHEVGADDAIADIIGSCMALHILKPDRIVVLPVSTGFGTVKIEHGIVPVPAPATAAILSDSSLIVLIGGGAGELLTPTGAAILAEIASETSDGNTGELKGTIVGIGYGAGSRDDKNSPNVIRMMLFEEISGGISKVNKERIDLPETDADDAQERYRVL